jgi:hypothetical protein
MYRSMLACCVLMLAAWPAAAQEPGRKGRAAAPPAAKGETGDTITIKGEQFRPFSADRLRAYGYDVPDLPRERNAAFVYLDAINASVDVPKDLQEAFDAATGGNWPEGEPGQRLSTWLEQNHPANAFPLGWSRTRPRSISPTGPRKCPTTTSRHWSRPGKRTRR